MRTVYDDPTFRICDGGRAWVSAWFGAPTAEHFRALTRAGEEALARDGDRALLFNVVVAGKMPRFSADVRAAALELTANDDLFATGTAHVILVDGLKGSAVRAFLSSLFVLGRPKVPNKVFAAIPDAASWAAGLMQAPETASDLSALIEASTRAPAA